jgi:hypothetical protein
MVIFLRIDLLPISETSRMISAAAEAAPPSSAELASGGG